MPRSYPEQRFRKGPQISPGGGSALRGPKRMGPIRGIVPGDDVEVAREIARLWEWHNRLEVATRRAEATAESAASGSGADGGCWLGKVMRTSSTLRRLYLLTEAGGLPQDSSGSKRHATSVVDTPSYRLAAPFPSEPTFKVMDFSPTAVSSALDTLDHVVIPSTGITFAGADDAFSVEVFVNPDTNPARQTIISCAGTNGTDGWSIGTKSVTRNGVAYCIPFFRRGAQEINTGLSFLAETLDVWYQIVAGFDGDYMWLGINGGYSASSKPLGLGVAIAAGSAAYVGREKDTGTNYYFDGKIGPIAIFNEFKTSPVFASRARCIGVAEDAQPGTDASAPPLSIMKAVGTGLAAGAGGRTITEKPAIAGSAKYWYARGWKLQARIQYQGASGIDSMSFSLNTSMDDLENNIDGYVAGAAQQTTSWQDLDQYAPSAGVDEHEALVLGAEATNTGASNWSIGAVEAQFRWVPNGTPEEVSNELPDGTADEQVLTWDTTTNAPQWDLIVNANIDAAAAIAKSKLAALNIVNADVDAAAAIAKSKLAALNIVNADVDAAAAIAVSKLAAAITNGHVLKTVAGVPTWAAESVGVTDHGALTGLGDDDHPQYRLGSVALVNADIAASAAIAATKLALPSMVRVGRSANLVVSTATWTLVPWTTELFDADGYHDNVTNNARLIVPSGLAGKFRVVCVIGSDPSSVSCILGLQVQKNSETANTAIFAQDSRNRVPGILNILYAEAVLDLVATDYVAAMVYQDSGSNLNMARSESWYFLQRLGP